jgi:hypothetical protein
MQFEHTMSWGETIHPRGVLHHNPGDACRRQTECDETTHHIHEVNEFGSMPFACHCRCSDPERPVWGTRT